MLIVALALETFFWVKVQDLSASLPSVSVYAGVCFQAETSFNFSLLTLTLLLLINSPQDRLVCNASLFVVVVIVVSAI